MSDKADIRELAVAAWRLEKWLDNLNADRKMAAKSALRSIKKYVTDCGVEVKDPIGSKFDPGLAVEVVNNEADGAPEETLIITETLAPYVYQNGELIQHARVIIGVTVNPARESNAIPPEADIITEATDVTEKATSTSKETDTKISSPDEDIVISPDDIERMKAYAKIF